MSPIARVFSVLNLILAASFLAWASTTLAHSQDWKNQFEAKEEELEHTVQEMDSEIKELETARDQARTEVTTLRGQRDNNEARADRLEGELSKKTAEYDEANAVTDRVSRLLGDEQADNRKLQAEKTLAVEARHEAENARADAEKKQQETQSKWVDAQAKIDSLENGVSDQSAEIVALNGTISELETQLTTVVEVTGSSFSDITAQPAIDATVMRAIHEISPGLVALNRGSDAGVKVGYTFEIYNGGMYKGQVRVENVRENMCTALVTTAVSGTQIGQGDKAATRL